MPKTLDLLRGLSEAGTCRVLDRLSVAQLEALWATMVADDDLPPADPHERLLWHVGREQRDRFLARYNRLPLRDKGAVYMRLIAGEDLDLIFDESPVPDGVGSPDDGNRNR